MRLTRTVLILIIIIFHSLISNGQIFKKQNIEQLIFKGDFSKANFILDKSLQNQKISSKDKIYIHQTKGDIAKLSGDIDFALVNWQMAAKLRCKIYLNKKDYHHAWTYASLSYYHYEKIHPDLAKAYADSCSSLIQNLSVNQQKEIEIYRIWNILAQSYKQRLMGEKNVDLSGRYKRILSFYQQSLTFITKYNCPKHLLGKTYHLLGNAYLDLAYNLQVQGKSFETQKFHEQSIQYYDKAIEIWKQLYGKRHYELGKTFFITGLSYSYTAKSFPENVIKSIQQFRLSADAYGLSIKDENLDAVKENPNKEDLLMCLKYYTTTLLLLDNTSKTNKNYLIEAEKVNRIALHLWNRIHKEFKSENTNQNLAIYSLLPQSEQLDILWRNSRAGKLDLEKFFQANQQLKYYDLNKTDKGFKMTTIKTLQQKLTRNQVYLDIQHSNNNGLFYIIQLQKNSYNVYVVNDSIIKSAERFKTAILGFDFEQYTSTSNALYKILFPYGIKQKEVILCPDSYFSTIPFDALLVSKKNSKTKDYRRLDYLLNHHEIRTVLTPSFFSNRVRHVNWEVSVFTPSVNNQRFSELVFSDAFGLKAEQELDVKLFSNARANKSNFINCNSSILHVSTHSIVGEDDSKNELLLSNSKLNQNELPQMKFIPSLVVLNSCNSGLGKQLEGEGLNGFVRELHRNGVQSTIANLWEVDDKASNELFFRFYSEFQQGASTSSALSAAKLHQIKNAPSSELGAPYYWAGHGLVGDDIEVNDIATNKGWLGYSLLTLFVAIFYLTIRFRTKRTIN